MLVTGACTRCIRGWVFARGWRPGRIRGRGSIPANPVVEGVLRPCLRLGGSPLLEAASSSAPRGRRHALSPGPLRDRIGSPFAGVFLGRAPLTVAVAVAAAAAAAVVLVGSVVAVVAVVVDVVVVAAAAVAAVAAGKVSAAVQKSYYSPTSRPYSAKMFALRSTGDLVSKRKPEVGGNGSCSREQEAERKVL